MATVDTDEHIDTDRIPCPFCEGTVRALLTEEKFRVDHSVGAPGDECETFDLLDPLAFLIRALGAYAGRAVRGSVN